MSKPVPAQRFGRFTAGAQCSQAQRIVALGQPHAGFIAPEWTMKKCRWRQAQRAVKQKLTRRADEQISAAHDLGDLHRRIVHHTRQLIRRHVVVPPYDEIAEILAGYELLRAEIAVHERNRLAIGNTEAPIEAG